MKKALLLYILCSGITVCAWVQGNDTKIEVEQNYDISQFETGDLVLRRGKGLISDVFCKASMNNNEFSHAGLLIVQNSELYVYHMIGEQGKNNGIKVERFNDFINEKENKAFAVYRYQFMKSYKCEIECYLRQLYFRQPSFDQQFSMDTDDALYCSEMIYKSIHDVCKQTLSITEVKDMKYVAIDNLYPKKLTTKLTSVIY